jgi:YHS domain-containing protein
MFRVILELLLSIAVIAIARVVLMGLMKGISSASSQAFQNPNSPRSSSAPEPPAAGLLHKDPVCGTFVAETTRFRRQAGGDTFFYCSEACQQKHLASRR